MRSTIHSAACSLHLERGREHLGRGVGLGPIWELQQGTNFGPNILVNNATYDAANNLLSFQYYQSNQYAGQETRQYNSLEQLTKITPYQGQTFTYTYPTGTNNGKISSEQIGVNGETITYQYDSLNRVSSASGSHWSETYGYDSFGNLLSKQPTGGAPQLSQAANPANNQIVGQSYDANGNQLTAPVGLVGYDVENRMLTASGVQYAYDSQNRRVWSATLDSNGNLLSQSAYFYGADGRRISSYTLTISGTQFSDPQTATETYFGARKVYENGQIYSEDQLGSDVSYSFYPWGEARGTNPQDAWSFATYWRDSATLLDYANNRYYSNAYGRFMTPDRSMKNVRLTSPQTWNAYTYVKGDPVNHNDPSGLTTCDENGDNCYDGVTVNGDTGESTWTDVFGSFSYNEQYFAPPDPVLGQIYNDAQAASTESGSCPTGETVMANGTCDLQLNPAALQVIADINAMDPGGFINAYAAAMGTAILGGDLAMAGADAGWLIESSNNAILLGRYADGYVNLGGIVGADTFSIPQSVWETMTPAQQLAANQEFLDSAIANGSTIMFSSDPALAPASSGLAWEYDYLVQQGFKVVQDANGGWVAVQ